MLHGLKHFINVISNFFSSTGTVISKNLPAIQATAGAASAVISTAKTIMDLKKDQAPSSNTYINVENVGAILQSLATKIQFLENNNKALQNLIDELKADAKKQKNLNVEFDNKLKTLQADKEIIFMRVDKLVLRTNRLFIFSFFLIATLISIVAYLIIKRPL